MIIRCWHILQRSLEPNHQPISLVKIGLISPSVEWLSVSTGWSRCKHKLGISVCLQTEDAYVLKRLTNFMWRKHLPQHFLCCGSLHSLEFHDTGWPSRSWCSVNLESHAPSAWGCMCSERVGQFNEKNSLFQHFLCCSSPYACKLHDTVGNCSKQNVSLVC